MRVDVYTLFPELIEHYAGSTILGRAQRDGFLEVNAVDLRSGATDERRTVDDTPFGGGAGMVLMADPLFRCVEAHEEERGAARPLISDNGGCGRSSMRPCDVRPHTR